MKFILNYLLTIKIFKKVGRLLLLINGKIEKKNSTT